MQSYQNFQWATLLSFYCTELVLLPSTFGSSARDCRAVVSLGGGVLFPLRWCWGLPIVSQRGPHWWPYFSWSVGTTDPSIINLTVDKTVEHPLSELGRLGESGSWELSFTPVTPEIPIWQPRGEVNEAPRSASGIQERDLGWGRKVGRHQYLDGLRLDEVTEGTQVALRGHWGVEPARWVGHCPSSPVRKGSPMWGHTHGSGKVRANRAPGLGRDFDES